MFEFFKPISSTLPVEKLPKEPVIKDSTQTGADPNELQKQIDELLSQAPDSPLLASLYNSLGKAYKDAILYAEAEQPYQKALELYERQLGADHPDVANSLNDLAGLYYLQGKYEEAEPLLVRSLEIRERQLGVDYPDVANSLNNLAALYQAQGKYSEAEPLSICDRYQSGNVN